MASGRARGRKVYGAWMDARDSERFAHAAELVAIGTVAGMMGDEEVATICATASVWAMVDRSVN